MEMRNYTPFMPLVFQSQDVVGTPFHVVVLKGTFRIVNGQSLQLAPEPRPLTLADEYYGDPTRSSLKRESDLAPFKPRADVHFTDPVAFAPAGKAAPRWPVKVRVGPIKKTVEVTGPRQWIREARSGWKLTEPEAVTEVPLRYEHAFGGAWQHNGEQGVCEENPVGMGCVNPRYLDGDEPVPAPQVEAPEDPVRELGKTHAPQGLGPLARAWQPRRGLAGTFDDQWVQERWPNLPADFQFSHYNSAPRDLIAPHYLQGDELVDVQGLHPEGQRRFRLPGHTVFLLLRYVGGRLRPVRLCLDTMIVDLLAGVCDLLWRLMLPLAPPLRGIEARMIQAKEAAHGA